MRRVFEIMQILMKYNFAQDVVAGGSGDLFLSGPVPGAMSPEDLARVKELGAVYYNDEDEPLWHLKY